MIRSLCKVVTNTKRSKKIYEMILYAPHISKNAKAGQFVNLYCLNSTRLLPRPISISEINGENISLIYKVVGQGTREFASLKANDEINVMGPVGNGFNITKSKKIALVGGGMGIAPLIELSKKLPKENVIACLGINTKSENGFLKEKVFCNECKNVNIVTIDGSYGTKGNVIDLLSDKEIDYIYACGPLPMLKALQKYMNQRNIDGEFSLEARMGCGGLGVCLSCVCKIKVGTGKDFKYEKVCEYGPVIDAKEVIFDE